MGTSLAIGILMILVMATAFVTLALFFVRFIVQTGQSTQARLGGPSYSASTLLLRLFRRVRVAVRQR